MQTNRAIVEWVSINEVLPNPLNPRKNDAIETETMQNIIRKRGWEEPLTVYRKGKVFVVLAGHRRLYAARESKIKMIPVYIVDAPTSHQDEIERIASLQSGRVDWTPFEWARFTYERWLAWGQPGIRNFAKEINISERTVSSYINVMTYYPVYEIEPGLKSGSLNVTFLDSLANWMKMLKKYHEELVLALTEDMVRKMMIEKFQAKLVSRVAIRRTDVLTMVSSDALRNFFLTKGQALEELLQNNNIDVKEQTFHGTLVSLGLLRKSVVNMNVKTETQAGKAVESLNEIKKNIEEQLRKIEKLHPDVVDKQTQLW